MLKKREKSKRKRKEKDPQVILFSSRDAIVHSLILIEVV